MKRVLLFTTLAVITLGGVWAQSKPQLALAKYDGGGDWYSDPTALTNLVAFCNADLQMGA